MKKWIVIGILALIALISYFSITGMYNGMVTKQEAVTTQWAQVETAYQRRADLIPNLVATVKGYAEFEKSTLTDVVNARAKATSVNISPEKLDEASLQKFQQAQNGLSSAIGRLMVVVEKYPELKANQNFLELQAQLEGTENRISTERRKFNETAQDYNVYIRKFPKSIFAGWFGFTTKAYFKADAGAEKAPKVVF
ncbi:MAG: LemA family protein [Bacteroidetes bacterium]|nr:LemA family protein [Bacteroidota bacterium]